PEQRDSEEQIAVKRSPDQRTSLPTERMKPLPVAAVREAVGLEERDEAVDLASIDVDGKMTRHRIRELAGCSAERPKREKVMRRPFELDEALLQRVMDQPAWLAEAAGSALQQCQVRSQRRKRRGIGQRRYSPLHCLSAEIGRRSK